MQCNAIYIPPKFLHNWWNLSLVFESLLDNLEILITKGVQSSGLITFQLHNGLKPNTSIPISNEAGGGVICQELSPAVPGDIL